MADSHITLENLTKQYPGMSQPAVDGLNLEIPRGEIVMLVGPSGSGKTTTLKMINRIIEPTSGRILIDGENIIDANPDEMRRRIGYVIQQVGLFPHMRISDNVATVPRLLKWPASKTKARVDELLDLVGLDPSIYRDRYPNQLSGGQKQRVGVARALAADPPVMLMDEPFGAVDPISRERLQSEFQRLQREIRKTIVFVTHDITEALTLGDRVVIFNERAEIAQYDVPTRLLTHPANQFVADFLGSRAGLRALELARVEASSLQPYPTASHALEASGTGDRVTVLCRGTRPWAVVAPGRHGEVLEIEPITLTTEVRLADVASTLLVSGAPCAVFVDTAGNYLGGMDIEAIQAQVKNMHDGDSGEAMRVQLAVSNVDGRS